MIIILKFFLAGGITNCPNWQQDVIKQLGEEVDIDNLVILNPRRENFPIDNPYAAEEQIDWEFYWLEQADIFSIFFSGGDSDQPICMYELGRNICRMQMKHPNSWGKRIIITCDDNYKRKQDVIIQTHLAAGRSVFISHDIGKDALTIHAQRIYRAQKHLKYIRGF